jgi:hypothetical protein
MILRLSVLFFLFSIAVTLAAASQRPRCDQSNPNVAVPDGPHGLFVVLFPQARRRAENKTKYILENPVVCGADIFVVWGEVDRGPDASPRYDWSSVDQQIAPWVKAGKVVNLIVWTVSYEHQAAASPKYVLSKGPTVDCPHFGDVPIFWEKYFKDNYQAFMSALVEKYGANPSLGYIRFGLGGGGETMPPCRFEFKRRYGLTNERWLSYLFEMMDYEKSLHSPKQILVSLMGQEPEMSVQVAEHAVKDGLAIGIQGLAADDMQNYKAGRTCKGNWCEMWKKYSGKVPLELQSLSKSEPDGSGTGSLVDLLPFALSLHTQIVEIYIPDWLLAYDPSDPTYPRYHSEYQQALEKAAEVVGGH